MQKTSILYFTLLLFIFIAACNQSPPNPPPVADWVAIDSLQLEWANLYYSKIKDKTTNEKINKLTFVLDSTSNKKCLVNAIFSEYIGYFKEKQGLSSEAIKYYEQSINYYSAMHYPPFLALYISPAKTLGNLCVKLGNYDKGIIVFEKAVALTEPLKVSGFSDFVVNLHLYADLANAYNKKGDTKASIDICKKGLTIIDSCRFDKKETLDLKFYLNASLVESYIANHNTTLALQYAEENIAIASQLDSEKTDLFANAYSSLASVCEEKKEYQKAQQNYQKALACQMRADGSKLSRESSKLLIKIGNMALENKQIQLALKSAEQSLSILFPNKKNAITEADFKAENAILETFDLLGRCYCTLANATKSNREFVRKGLKYNELALKMSDYLTSHFTNESATLDEYGFRRNIFETQMDLYEKCWQKEKSENVFEAAYICSEKSRAMLLNQQIKNNNLVFKQGVSSKNQIFVQIQTQKNSLSNLQNMLIEADNEAKKSIKQQIFTAQEALGKLNTEAEKMFPNLKDEKEQKVVDLKTVKNNLLGNQNAIVEYFYDENKEFLYTFYISKQKNAFFKTKMPKKAVVDVVELMSTNQNFDSLVWKNYSEKAAQLYDFLLKKVYEPTCNELIIVPDGALCSVPFDALLYQKPQCEKGNFRDLPYLLQLVSCRLTPSLSILSNSQNHNKQTISNYYLGIAPDYALSEKLANVHYSKDCVAELAGLFKGKTLFANQASIADFKTEAPKYKIVHFYGHAEAQDSMSEFSWLAFSTKKNTLKCVKIATKENNKTLGGTIQIPENEQLIFAHELNMMQINADLIVLSACKTGIGKFAVGEGAMSLSRAFLLAGCPNQLMSLWYIDDKATAKVSSLFLQNIYQKHPKSWAATNAKRAYLADKTNNPYPYFWSGLVFTGDNSIIP